jgi:hypothetical protein
MIENVVHQTGSAAGVDDVLSRFAAVVAEINTLDLDALVRLDGPSAQLVALGARVETVRRRLQVFDRHYVAALEKGDEPARHGCPSTAAFLTAQLRLSPGAAKRRVEIAHATTAREEFGAGVLPPRCPTLAAAQETGSVSAEHASVVVAALDQVPARLAADAADDVAAMEARLVTESATFSPGQVASLGRHILDHIDPDGTLRDADWQQQTRTATLVRHHDGTGTLRARLTTPALEVLQTALEPLAKPVPASPPGDQPDPRTAGQRLHDALQDLAQRALDGGDLPACGGTPATVVIHLTMDQLTRRTGLALTDHGHQIPTQHALALADHAAVHLLHTDAKGVPLQLGRTVRIATPGQTIALAARDRGCSAPGCDRPPSWCQRHHVVAWQDGGETNLDNLTLLCGYHHRTFEARGWTCLMINGRPWWRPPAWIDPERKPIRNTHFDPLDCSP